MKIDKTCTRRGEEDDVGPCPFVGPCPSLPPTFTFYFTLETIKPFILTNISTNSRPCPTHFLRLSYTHTDWGETFSWSPSHTELWKYCTVTSENLYSFILTTYWDLLDDTEVGFHILRVTMNPVRLEPHEHCPNKSIKHDIFLETFM